MGRRARPALIGERIVLGTVQLGLPYGRRRHERPLARAAALAVLDSAWDLGIRVFDTAEAYGDAPVRLGAWITSRGHAAESHVLTKVDPRGGGDITALARAALDRFPSVAGLTLLTHGIASGDQWQAVLAVAQRRGVPVGQSVYGPDEVAIALALPDVSRLQAPGNVFDLGALEARGSSVVPIDLRSVYLQGALLEAPALAEARAPGTGALAAAVGEAALTVGEPPAVMLLAVMDRACRPDDRLVVGVDSPEQLGVIPRALTMAREVVDAFARLVRERAPVTVRSGALDPRSW